MDLPLTEVYIPPQNAEVLPHGGMTGGSSTTELIGQVIHSSFHHRVTS